jgi:type IV pilus secretin PilQ/predicted competence protein
VSFILRRPVPALAVVALLSLPLLQCREARAEDPADAPAAQTQTQEARPPAVTGIGVAKSRSGTQITISGDADLAYEYFVIEGKSLVVDIPGATNGVWPANRQLDDDYVGRMRIEQRTGERPGVRVAFDLLQPAPFTIEPGGRQITVSFLASAAQRPTPRVAVRDSVDPASENPPAPAQGEGVRPAPPAPAPLAVPAARAPRALANRVTDVTVQHRSNEFRITIPTTTRPVVKRTDKSPTTLRFSVLDASMAAPYPRITDYARLNTAVQSVAAWPEGDAVIVEVNLFEKKEPNVSLSEQGLAIVFELPDSTDVPSTQAAPPPPSFLEMGMAKPILPQEVRNYSPYLINLDFQDADITEIFAVIASITKVNIVTNDGVRGKRTVRLESTPWDQALELLCETHTPMLVQIRESDNVIRVTTYDQFLRDQSVVANKKAELEKEKAKAEQEKANADAAKAKTEQARVDSLEAQMKREYLKRLQEEEETRRTSKLERRTFKISYGDVERIGERIRAYSNTTSDSTIETRPDAAAAADANQVAYRSVSTAEGNQTIYRSATAGGQRPAGVAAPALRSSRVRPVSFQRNDIIFEVNKDSKSIFVQDFAENIALMSLVVAALDQPPPAVMVEARIVEVFSNTKTSLGIQWGAQFFADAAHGNSTGYAFPNSISLTNGALQSATGVNPGNYLVNLPAANPVAGVGFSLGHVADTLSLDVKLSAMESLGLTKVLSNPKVLVLQNKEASINIGRQLPVPKTDALGAKTVEWLPVGILLKVTPEITNDGKVIMQLAIEKSDVGETVPTTEGPMYSLTSNKAQTRIIIGDGETSVIGGLFSQTKQDDQSGVPGLSKIPLLGWLFKSKTAANNRSELMIFITPKLVSAAPEALLEPPAAQ